jgi:trigger factor
MKVTVENKGPCRRVLHVAVPGEAVRPEYEAVVGSFIKASRLDGFRPGRAPARVIERAYGKAIVQETKERLVRRLYREALREQGILPVAIVGVGDVLLDPATGLSFDLTIDVPPDFTLPRYRNIPLTAPSAEVTDAQAADVFERLLKAHSRYVEVPPRPAQAGDLVCIDYRGECDGQPLAALAADAAPLGEGKDFMVLVAEPEFLPGLARALAGMQVGETRRLTVVFPADYQVPAVAGRTVEYAIAVKGIRERVAPVLDAEFLKRFAVDSETALKQKLRAQLEAEAQRVRQERLKGQIARFLLTETRFEVPQSVVEEETGLAIQGMVRRIALEGGTREQILEQREAIYDTAAQSSVERVKLAYVLTRIAEEEQIGVADEEVEERIRLMAQELRMPPERLRAEIEKRNGIEKLRSDIRADKTLDRLLENAVVKTEEGAQ